MLRDRGLPPFSAGNSRTGRTHPLRSNLRRIFDDHPGDSLNSSLKIRELAVHVVRLVPDVQSAWLLCVDPFGEIDAQTSRQVLENAQASSTLGDRRRGGRKTLSTGTTIVLRNVTVLRLFGGACLSFTERNVSAIYHRDENIEDTLAVHPQPEAAYDPGIL